MEQSQISFLVAGLFTLVATILTGNQIRLHLHYNSHPNMRRWTIRILAMVPVYGAASWLGLRYSSSALYFDLFRDCYEALVIYSFYQLLVSHLGGEESLMRILARKPPQKHLFPFCCLPSWQMASFALVATHHSPITTHINRRQEQHIDGDNNGINNISNKSSSHSVTSHPIADNSSRNHVHPEKKNSPPFSSVLVNAATTHPSSSSSCDVAGHTHTPDLHGISSGGVISDVSSSPILPVDPLSSHTYGRARVVASSDFLLQCQLGTLQYCVCKPLTALLAFSLELTGRYGEGELDYSYGYPYLAFVTNLSQLWAMYCLITFYMATKEELQSLRPVPKFLCVKAVVFFTFWQSVLLVILAHYGIIHDTESFSEDRLQAALQDFIVCIEMTLAAIAHHYAFNYRDFLSSGSVAEIRAPLFRTLLEAVNVTDIYVHDVPQVRRFARRNKALAQGRAHELLLDDIAHQHHNLHHHHHHNHLHLHTSHHQQHSKHHPHSHGDETNSYRELRDHHDSHIHHHNLQELKQPPHPHAHEHRPQRIGERPASGTALGEEEAEAEENEEKKGSPLPLDAHLANGTSLHYESAQDLEAGSYKPPPPRLSTQ